MGVVSQGSPRIDRRSGVGRRRVTAKVAIPVVLLCGGVGAVLGSVFPPDVLVSRVYQAAYQHEPDKSPLAPAEKRPVATATEETTAKPASAPPSASTTEPSVHVGEQSRSPSEPAQPQRIVTQSQAIVEPPAEGAREPAARPREQSASAQEPVSVPTPAPAQDHAVSPADQRAAIDEAKSAEASLPVSRATAEKLERRSAARRKARQERAALAKRKQYAAPSKPAPAKSPGIISQIPSISTRVSEQWWR